MRVVGIDIGAYSIKIIEIDAGFGRTEIHDYHERKLDKDSNAVAVAVQMLTNLKKRPEKIAISLPQTETTFRNLQLPTKDKRAVKAAIAFELEDELPFDLEKSTFDHTILNQGKNGTHVHIAATLKKYAASVISEFNDYGVDPDIITTQTWASRTLLNRVFAKEPPEDPVMMVQLGKTRTSIYVHWKGTPIIGQEISWGGDDVTFAIQQKYRINEKAAEKAKLSNGFVLTENQKSSATKEQIDFSETIYAAMKPLLVELRQSTLACKNQTTKYIQSAFISGGPALLPGMRSVVEETIRTRVRSLHGLSSITTSGVKYSEETDNTFLPAAGTALTATSQERANLINFRRGDLAKARESEDLNLTALKKPVMATMAVLFCFFLSLFVQSNYYEGKMEELDRKVRRGASGIFGSLSPRAFRSRFPSASKLKKEIQKKLDSSREVARLFGSDPKSPVDFLRGLSTTVPKGGVVVDMVKYSVGSSPEQAYNSKAKIQAKITFLVQSAQVADRLERHIRKVLDKPSKSELKKVPSPDGKGSKWEVTFTGIPKESAYE